MTVPRITSAEVQDRFRRGITNRNSTYDTAYGAIPDLFNPVADVIAEQNDDLRAASLLVSFKNVDQLASSDIDALLFNESETRSGGSRALSICTFAVRTAPTTNTTVRRGFPVATSPDAGTGGTVVFVATETRTLVLGTGYNVATRTYELDVPVQALVEGPDGVVGAGRIHVPMQPLGAWDSVTNKKASDGGLGPETNTQAVDRYLLSVLGTQLNSPLGVERRVRRLFKAVSGTNLIYGTDPALTRASSEAGAVDLFIRGTQASALTENLVFLGVGQLIPVTFAPILNVASVSAYIEGQDYDVVLDTTGLGGSTRAVEGIRFRTGGPNALPAVGATVAVTYTYNALVGAVQADLNALEGTTFGRNLLVRQGTRVDIYLDARLTALTGFTSTSLKSLAASTLFKFINSELGLGSPVEFSDLDAKVRALSGVDNFKLTRLSRTAAGTGTDDIANILGSEYPAITQGNLRVT